jgi:hypothetical protein
LQLALKCGDCPPVAGPPLRFLQRRELTQPTSRFSIRAPDFIVPTFTQNVKVGQPARQSSSGHVWQGRFYSCPLDEGHLWEALRYAELNPVRAGLVEAAARWPWSSAAAHCGFSASDTRLDMKRWQTRWTAGEWRQFLLAGDSPSDLAALRQCTHTGRPLGTPDFVVAVEASTSRQLAPRKAGRPSKHDSGGTRPLFTSVA